MHGATAAFADRRANRPAGANGASVSQLTVSRRRSGIPHSAAVQYVADGEVLLVVRSNWGLPIHPIWSTNLLAAKHATIRRGQQVEKVVVEMLTGAAHEWAGIRFGMIGPISLSHRSVRRNAPSVYSRSNQMRSTHDNGGHPPRR
jgi:deazaflavin-dependent oxidoreductase (nitroreductase family)